MAFRISYLCEVHNFEQYEGDSPDRLKAVADELAQLEGIEDARMIYVGTSDVTLQIDCNPGALEFIIGVLDFRYMDLKMVVTLRS